MDDRVVRLQAEMEERNWWFVGRRRILHRLIERLVPATRRRVLVDVGCGTGGNVGPLADRYECVGVDPTPEALRVAHRRFPSVRFLQGGTGAAAALGEIADVLLLTDVLEHVEDDRRAYGDCLRAVRPGGHMIVTVPAHPRLFGPHDRSLGHHRRYTAESLGALLDHADSEVRLLSHFNSRLFPLAGAVRLATRLVGRSAGREGADLHSLPRPLERWLASVFAGEWKRLWRALSKHERGYRTGLSLIAVVRKASATRGAG